MVFLLTRGYHKIMLNIQEKNECFANLRNLKECYIKEKPQLSRELKERIESWIKIIPKIIKNPIIVWHTEGNFQIPYLKIGYPKSKYCLYCHDELRNNMEKNCGSSCKSYRSKKNRKRRELEADMISWGKDIKGKNFQRLTYLYKHKIKNKMKYHSIIIDLSTRNRNPKK